jgi:hypothetical protein
MTRFEDIPDDVIFLIANEVTLEDIYSLSLSHPGLRWLTSANSIAKKLLKACLISHRRIEA